MQFTRGRYNYKYASRIDSIIVIERNPELLMDSIQKQRQQEKFSAKDY